MAASSLALTLCEKSDWSTPYDTLHSIYNRATPSKVMKYKHSLELYRLYNREDSVEDWVDLNVQQNINSRSPKIQIVDLSRLKVGKNVLLNKLTSVNNLISFEWLNLWFDIYKLKCKSLFLQKDDIERTMWLKHKVWQSYW